MDQEKRALILNPQRMKLAEYERQDWVINAEDGTSPDDLKDPGFWAHVSAQMKPYDHVEVRIDRTTGRDFDDRYADWKAGKAQRIIKEEYIP